jgi:pimeloyl-ACP methyl ester carboxylesterase
MLATGRSLRTLSVGAGPAVVLLHGFAMQPETYLPLARLLADRVRVVIPAIFELPGGWRYTKALSLLESTLDDLQLDRVTLLGHSFGGGLELGLASHHPGRVVECVFADTLGLHTRFDLAGEAMHHPVRILGMASRPAAEAFARSWATHPVQLVESALWGFASDREPDIERIRRAGIPCHVMWASRDSLLARSSGLDFARKLNASFTVAARPKVDHDWMFDDPDLFARQLATLGLRALPLPPGAPIRNGPRRRPPPATGRP